MSTAKPPSAPALVAGQRLRREVFHELYEAAPPGTRAELIGGVVFMPSPVGDLHAIFTAGANGWVWSYSCRTPGTLVADNGSTALDDLTEVQPDVSLRINPEFGGQTRRLGNIVGGAPELIVEVAVSSKAVDLGPKLAEYERAGTLEYIVLAIDPDEVFWHLLRDGRLVRVDPNPDGLYRSATFPGLWLDPAAILANDGPAILATLNRGLATAEHAAFVARLVGAERGG